LEISYLKLRLNYCNFLLGWVHPPSWALFRLREKSEI